MNWVGRATSHFAKTLLPAKDGQIQKVGNATDEFRLTNLRTEVSHVWYNSQKRRFPASNPTNQSERLFIISEHVCECLNDGTEETRGLLNFGRTGYVISLPAMHNLIPS